MTIKLVTRWTSNVPKTSPSKNRCKVYHLERVDILCPLSLWYYILMEKNTTQLQETIEELAAKNADLEKQKEVLDAKIKWLEEQFRLSQQKKFGTSSEKSNPNQTRTSPF